jgi:hypothetical protein
VPTISARENVLAVIRFLTIEERRRKIVASENEFLRVSG